MSQGTTPPGWYDDGHGAERWWDGSTWTEQTRPAGGGQPGGGQPGSGQPGAPAGAPTPTLHDEPTRFGPAGATPGQQPPAATSQPPAAPQPPAADVTQVASAGGFGAPGGPAQPGSPYGAPAQPGQPYGAPGQPVGSPYGAPGQPAGSPYGAPGQPAGSPYGAPGQPGQPAWQSAYPTSGSGGGKGRLIAIVGGAVAALLVAIVVLVVVLGGGGPEDVVEDYIDASLDLDYERACELTASEQQREAFETSSTDDCAGLADSADGFVTDEQRGFFEDIDYEVEIGDVEEDGDSATVQYTITSEYTGDDEAGFRELTGEESLTSEESDSLELVKEDGDWKIAESL